MGEYPREDKPLVVCLSDNTQVTGLVNTAGRTTQGVLEGKGADLVLYDARAADGARLGTILVAKDRISWIAPAGEGGSQEPTVLLKQVRLRLANGLVISGRVETAGFARVSDYFHAFEQRFIELREASLEGRTHAVLYVGNQQVLWKEPVD